MSVDLSQFHQVFFEESFENLDAMETQLMALDPSDLDDETINSIFRAAHSIKGGAGTFGFTSVADFTHLLETLLDQLRSGQRDTSQDEVDLYLQSVDCLRELLQSCQQGKAPSTDRPRELSAQFERLLSLKLESSSKTNNENDSKSNDSRSNVETMPSVWHILFKPGPSLLTSGNEPLRLFRVLADMGELDIVAHTDAVPTIDELIPQICYLYWDLQLTAAVSKQKIEEVFEWVTDEAEVEIRVAVGKNASEKTPSNWQIDFVPEPKILISGNDPVRLLRELTEIGSCETIVDASQLPNFENYHADECYLSWTIKLQANCDQTCIAEVFEWVMDEARVEITQHHQPKVLLNQAVAQVEETITAIAQTNGSRPTNTAGSAPKMESSSIRVAIDKIDNLINMVGELVITQSMLGQIGSDFSVDKLPRLREGLGQLEHNTRELQESVMRIRMLPISFAFSRFPRMVRDLGRRLDKQINLVLQGEQTELDKTVMERIGDPLVHLVRNAIDHGIETSAERARLGKSAEGKITLNAYHQSGNVVIEVIDNGGGIDRSKLLAKACKQGLITESESLALSDSQAFDYIFHPGLSTAAEVSDVSGRGVGMDVVKRNIQELNGNIDIKSQTGVGTTITIRLPLTLAILDGQLVRVGTNVYIFPLVSIVESMQVKNEQLNNVAGGCEVFKLRDEYIPIVRLYEIFKVNPDSTDIEDSLLVVVEADGEKIGVVVDELSAQQQVVIKSLEQNYERIEGVSGATILGDGTVSLILDIPGIVKLSGAFQLSFQNLIHQGKDLPSQAMN